MDNQHRAIKGYQEMDQEKIDLFNKITVLGSQIESLVDEVTKYNEIEYETRFTDSLGTVYGEKNLNPPRWIAMAVNDFQTAMMKLKRGLAKPTTF